MPVRAAKAGASLPVRAAKAGASLPVRAAKAGASLPVCAGKAGAFCGRRKMSPYRAGASKAVRIGRKRQKQTETKNRLLCGRVGCGIVFAGKKGRRQDMKKKTHTKKIHTQKPRLFSLAALCGAGTEDR